MAAAVFVALALGIGASALQLFHSAPSGIPSACGDALATNITCSQFVSVSAVSRQQYIGNATLELICAADWRDSLYKYRNDVGRACATTVYDFSGVNQTVQSFLGPLTWAYNVSCLTSGDEYCYSEITKRDTRIQPCSDCFLRYEAAMLGSPYGQPRVDSNAFSFLLSSCSILASSYPYTTPTKTSTSASTTMQSATITPTTCSGTSYAVRESDSCDSIASAHNIATDRFITENNLDLNCTTLSVGDHVCLGDSCALYQVQTNDTCKSILANHTFYQNQLLSWNRTIHAKCDNLKSMVGKNICISPPGSDESQISSANTLTTQSTFVLPTTAFTTLPPQTAAPNYTTSWFVTTTTISIRTETATVSPSAVVSAYNELLKYYPITFNDTMSGWDIYSLPGDCIDGLLEYCDPPLNGTMPASTSFPATCSPAYYDATSTSTPTSPTSSFLPTQTGVASNCDAFYIVKANDTCASIVDSFSHWNPYVSDGSDCQHLWLDTYVCVGAPNKSTTGAHEAPTKTTSTSIITTTTSTTTAPSSLLSATVANCAKYHHLVCDVNCANIEDEYSITAAQLNNWNPSVGAECKIFWLSY
ncbi:hypothetical protein BDW72DRAFT_208065 [Aspergillus terricola var. indicus]